MHSGAMLPAENTLTLSAQQARIAHLVEQLNSLAFDCTRLAGCLDGFGTAQLWASEVGQQCAHELRQAAQVISHA